MRKLLFIGILLFCLPAFADVSLPLIVEEVDTDPSVVPYKMIFTNGTLTDNTDGTVTIDISGTGDADQNLWETFNSDSGTTTADSTTDTLTVSGGGTVTTAISGDTLTITGAAGSAAAGGSSTHIQFNDATVISGNPGFSFNKTTATTYTAGNAHIVGTAHIVGSMGAQASVDTPFLENSFGGPVGVRDKVNSLGYDVGTTVITVNTFTDEGIQAAIDALPITGGIVQLLPGTYVVDDGGTITFPQRKYLNISLVGSGMSSILNHTATDSSDCISAIGIDDSNKSKGITFRDFKIVGNASSGDGIYLNDTWATTINNVVIESCGAIGIKTDDTSSLAIIDVEVDYCGSHALYLAEAHQARIIGFYANTNTGDGIHITLTYEAVISGCALEYNGSDGIELALSAAIIPGAPGIISGNQMSSNSADGIKIENAFRWGIVGNLVSQNSGDGIQITNSQQLNIVGNLMFVNDYPIKLANVSDSIIANNKWANSNDSDTILQDSDCHNNQIFNNSSRYNDSIIAFGTPITIEDCEDAWVAKGNVASTANTSTHHILEGRGSSRNSIEAAFGSGLIATEDFTAIDLSGYANVGFWIKATEDVAANVLELVLDDDAACASPLETLSIPALSEDVFKYVELSFSDPSALTAIISVGLNADSDPGTVVVYLDDITTEYPKVWYDTSEDIFYAHIIATASNIKSEPKHLRFNLWDPNAIYDDDETVCIWPQTDAAITVSKIELTLDADPTTELNTDLMFANVFISHPSATVIDELTTTSGTTSISSGFDDATVPASKAIFIRFDGDPDSAITQASYNITFSYD